MLFRVNKAFSAPPNRLFAMIALITVLTSVSISAQSQDAWEINPQHSVATLSLGSDSDVLQLGVVRLNGEVVFESDSEDPTVTFSTAPSGGPGVNYPKLEFNSQQCRVTPEGKLLITGELSVTRVERSITADPNEAYAGQQYGPPEVHTATREITLVFPDPPPNRSSAAVMHLSGTGSVSRENFPQLAQSIALDHWPTQLVNDEKCIAPSTIGEDYHGAICTGTVIASVRNVMVPSGGGFEDFAGLRPAVNANRNQVTIAVNLELKRVNPH